MRKQIATLERIGGELKQLSKELLKLRPAPDPVVRLTIHQGIDKVENAAFLLEVEAKNGHR